MDSFNTAGERDIPRILKEDILRILGEREEKLSLEALGLEFRVSQSFLYKTIRSLEQEKTIQIKNGFVKLTAKGREETRDLLRKHILLETYFKKRRNHIEAHETADLIEHYVSEEVINNTKRLSELKDEGVPLTEFELNREGIITDIMFTDHTLFERMISMGIFLGEKLVIMNKIHHGVIIKIRNKKLALDRELAKEIKVVEHEKP